MYTFKYGVQSGLVTYFQAEGEKGQDSFAGLVAELGEAVDFGLVGCERRWERLLGFAIFEVTKVHGSVVSVRMLSC